MDDFRSTFSCFNCGPLRLASLGTSRYFFSRFSKLYLVVMIFILTQCIENLTTAMTRNEHIFVALNLSDEAFSLNNKQTTHLIYNKQTTHLLISFHWFPVLDLNIFLNSFTASSLVGKGVC